MLAGEILFVGHFLAENAREVKDATGAVKFIGHEVTVLRGNESVPVSCQTPRGITSTAQVKLLGHKRMTPVVVELSEYAHTTATSA
ncbi:MAG: hypothetical protein ABMA26_16195 [Limisphaerales bacterium]